MSCSCSTFIAAAVHLQGEFHCKANVHVVAIAYVQGRSRDFSVCHHFQTCLGAHPACSTIVQVALFPGTAWPENGAEHSVAK